VPVNVADFFAGSGLILVPHMDDEALACGGTIALLPDKAAWHLVYFTDGLGSPEPVLPGRDTVSPDLGQIRQAEARSAMALLGIPPDNVHFLNLPDGRLSQHQVAVDEAVAYWVRQLQPDHLLVPFRYDRHPDHLALNRAAVRLARNGRWPGQISEYFVYYQWRLLPQGDVRRYIRPGLLHAVDITAVTPQKRAALDCYASQTTRFYPWQARPNLTAELLDAVSQAPEIFLRYDHGMAGTAVFSHAVPWIRLAHRLEPFLKKRKDRLVAWWRRGIGARPDRLAITDCAKPVRSGSDSQRPIRVVMFGGGPVLERDVKQFLLRLEDHPDIELLGAFCQSAGQSVADVVANTWQRRRWLAPAVLGLQLLGIVAQWLRRPRLEWALRRDMGQLNGRIHFIPDIHDEVVLAQVRALQPDLGLIYGSPILKPALFEIPAQGTLGIHHGQVPQYRGKKTTFWAMYHGEPVAGVTIQKVTAGLDTGQIVRSGEVPIGRRRYGAVWRDVLALGLDLYIEAILQVRNGTAVYRPQTGPKGKLYRDPKPADILRFWWRRIRRMFRA
jgi:LmbE family N-acetylglucosaminyl deacetylase